MRLKNKKGLTAMADAMIFIVVMGLAVSAFFAFGDDASPENDASQISESIFSAKLRASDVLDTDDSRLIGVPDMVVFHILTGKSDIIDYIEDILDSLFQKPDSYCLEIGYNGDSIVIGYPEGAGTSSSVKEFTVTYGGSITASLTIY